MAKLAPSKKIGFDPADPALKIVGSRLYYGPEGTTWDSNNLADYDKPFIDLGLLVAQTVTLADGTSAQKRVIDTSKLPGIEGTEALSLVDYDAAPNYSDFAVPVIVPLDHLAPPAPTGGVVLP